MRFGTTIAVFAWVHHRRESHPLRCVRVCTRNRNIVRRQPAVSAGLWAASPLGLADVHPVKVREMDAADRISLVSAFELVECKPKVAAEPVVGEDLGVENLSLLGLAKTELVKSMLDAAFSEPLCQWRYKRCGTTTTLSGPIDFSIDATVWPVREK